MGLISEVKGPLNFLFVHVRRAKQQVVVSSSSGFFVWGKEKEGAEPREPGICENLVWGSALIFSRDAVQSRGRSVDARERRLKR